MARQFVEKVEQPGGQLNPTIHSERRNPAVCLFFEFGWSPVFYVCIYLSRRLPSHEHPCVLSVEESLLPTNWRSTDLSVVTTNSIDSQQRFWEINTRWFNILALFSLFSTIGRLLTVWQRYHRKRIITVLLHHIQWWREIIWGLNWRMLKQDQMCDISWVKLLQ